MSTDPTRDAKTRVPSNDCDRLVAHYSAPHTLNTALERVMAEARRREKARELITRARGGLLHNHTVREVARYFRAADRGWVDLLQVADSTGLHLSDTRQVLREFVDAGLLEEQEEPYGGMIRRSYKLIGGAKGGITDVFVETEAATKRREHTDQAKQAWLPGWLRQGRAQ